MCLNCCFCRLFSRPVLQMSARHWRAWWRGCRSTATPTLLLLLSPGLVLLVVTPSSTLYFAPMLSSSRANRPIGKTTFSSMWSPLAPTRCPKASVRGVLSTRGSSWTTPGASCWTDQSRAGQRSRRWWAGWTATLASPLSPSSPLRRPWSPTRRSLLTTSRRRFLFPSSRKCVSAPFLKRKAPDLNMARALTEDLIGSHRPPLPIYQSTGRGRGVEKKAEMRRLWSCNWIIGAQQQQRKLLINFSEGPKVKMETRNRTWKSRKNLLRTRNPR